MVKRMSLESSIEHNDQRNSNMSWAKPARDHRVSFGSDWPKGAHKPRTQLAKGTPRRMVQGND